MSWYGAKSLKRSASKHQSAIAGGEQAESLYLVATGAIVFTQHATSGREALERVKARLQAACASPPNRYDPGRLSQALLESFIHGRLDFVVMNGERTRLVCGEYGGVFEEPVSRRLSDSMKHLIPVSLEIKRRAEVRRQLVPATSSKSVNRGPELRLYA